MYFEGAVVVGCTLDLQEKSFSPGESTMSGSGIRLLLQKRPCDGWHWQYRPLLQHADRFALVIWYFTIVATTFHRMLALTTHKCCAF